MAKTDFLNREDAINHLEICGGAVIDFGGGVYAHFEGDEAVEYMAVGFDGDKEKALAKLEECDWVIE